MASIVIARLLALTLLCSVSTPAAALSPRWTTWMSLDLALSSGTPKSAPRPARDGYTSQADEDRVDSLPGFKNDGNLPFGLYAGCGQRMMHTCHAAPGLFVF